MGRFDMDYDTFTRYKINDYFEFPETLDLWPYSTEGVQQRDAVGGGMPENRIYKEHPQEYYEFTLAGVVVHMGSAETGHYYSFIREREPRCDGKVCHWFRFDDSVVSEF